MYDELIERLRECATEVNCIGCDCNNSLMKQAADAIEELQQITTHYEEESKGWWLAACDAKEERERLKEQIPKWIPVTERLPEEDESVFVVRKFLGLKGQVPPSIYVEIAYRIGDGWVADSDEYKIARNRHTDPLYWMPLPEPPKDGEA